ncbi:helix-turn-helix domain-containing protein [Frankia sp. Cr2]|uniref:winged helix-turn-helix transcriptional regulator n=1 Tax=Frankia sp. Cr2 TaxID=3073932 RepID=UPI002AD5B160|nr:helix-turn-helix domain-containing protein [Frankia sp. Cr2]
MSASGSAAPAPLAVDAFSSGCPPRALLNTVGDKWVILVVNLLGDGGARFSEIQRAVGGVSRKMLVQTLRTLERDGLAVRTVYADAPPRVTYSLTPLGQTLLRPLQAVRTWCEDHVTEVSSAQAVYDARPEYTGSAATG